MDRAHRSIHPSSLAHCYRQPRDTAGIANLDLEGLTWHKPVRPEKVDPRQDIQHRLGEVGRGDPRRLRRIARIAFGPGDLPSFVIKNGLTGAQALSLLVPLDSSQYSKPEPVH